MKLYYEDIYKAREQHPECEIRPLDNTLTNKWCNSIISKSCGPLYEVQHDLRSIRKYFQVSHPAGQCDVILSYDPYDGNYYDICRYRIHKFGSLTIPVLWDITTPEKFFSSLTDKMEIRVLCEGFKVTKPKDLNKLERVGSVKFSKATCTIYRKSDRIYIKHNDFFSPTYCKPEDIGTPLSYRMQKYGMNPRREKFCYADNWGDIVLRRRAWIEIKHAYSVVDYLNASQFSRMAATQWNKLYPSLTVGALMEWERFFEDVYKVLKSNLNNL